MATQTTSNNHVLLNQILELCLVDYQDTPCPEIQSREWIGGSLSQFVDNKGGIK